MHENLNQFRTISASSDRNFCLTFCAVFMAVAFYPLVHQNPLRWWAFGGAATFLLLAFVKPQLASSLNRLWVKIGVLAGKVVTPIVLGSVYFTIFLITGLVLKLFKKDILGLKLNPSAKTYWIKRENGHFSENMFKNQF